MSSDSAIEWTNATWNPVSGCTRVSAGCDNCYAVKMTHRLEGMGQEKYAGLTVLNRRGERHFNGTVRCHEDALTIPLGWRKPRLVFVNSMSDLFHRDVPFEFIDQVFAVMALCPHHTFQVLTKRPERMAEYLNSDGVQHRVAKAMDAIEVQREIDALDEAWKPVGGFPGYEVSNHGRVKGPRGILTPQAGEQGHSRVTLYRDGIEGRVLVHRLVLRVWKDQARSDDEQVRHRNGDPTCNALPNLLVGTQAENWADSKRHGSHRRYSKLSPDDVAAIRTRAANGEAAYSIAKDYPVSDTQIRNILRGDQWSTKAGIAWPLPGVWLGASVENQEVADERIPHLLRCPAAVRFLSCEPLLGPVDLRLWLEYIAQSMAGPLLNAGELHWVIAGGESGPDARDCHVEWIRSIIQQCRAAGVPCFVKQLGKWPILRAYEQDGKRHIEAVGTKNPKGGDPAEWPEDLRVREMPQIGA